jgi:hypothetical protein
MSLLPMYKKSKICGRTYSFNPDVGQMFCPYCAKSKENKIEKKIMMIFLLTYHHFLLWKLSLHLVLAYYLFL